MGRPKGSKNKVQQEIPTAKAVPIKIVVTTDTELADEDVYPESWKDRNCNIKCGMCNTEVAPGKSCNCKRAPIHLLNTRPYLTVKAASMDKVRFFNNATEEWFKPLMA